MLWIVTLGMALAQGMFDLPEGRWKGTTLSGKTLQLSTQKAQPHHFSLECSPAVKIEGHYRVRANKGQPHVSLIPERILVEHREQASFSLEGWHFWLAQESRAILDYSDSHLNLDSFGQESDFLWRLELKDDRDIDKM
jgi:hypothetical protein